MRLLRPVRTGFTVFRNVLTYCRIIARYSSAVFLKDFYQKCQTSVKLTVFEPFSVICGTRSEIAVLLLVFELLLFCLFKVCSTESLGACSTADREEIISGSGFLMSFIGVLFMLISSYGETTGNLSKMAKVMLEKKYVTHSPSHTLLDQKLYPPVLVMIYEIFPQK